MKPPAPLSSLAPSRGNERRRAHSRSRCAARVRHRGVSAGRACAPARPAAVPRPRHGHRDRRPGLDRLLELRAGANDRHRRARPDPLRRRPDGGARCDPSRPASFARPRARGHVPHRSDHRARGRLALRPERSRGAPARLDHRLHRRRRGLLDPARLDAAPPARSHARGRGRLQRPGGGAAGDRLHRVDRYARLRRLGHGRAVRDGARDRAAGRGGGRLAGGGGAAPRAPRYSRALSRRHARHGGGGLRGGRHPPRIGLPRRLPERPGARLGLDSRAPDRDRVPSGPGLGRPDHDVPRSRPARVPQPPRRRLDRGHRARAAPAVRGPAGRDLRLGRRSTPFRSASGWSSAGPGCAGPFRWCSRPFR